MSKYTEGPWLLGCDLTRVILDYRDESGNSTKDCLISSNGWAKSVCKINHSQYIQHESVANGRLIAQAPAMHKELKKILKGVIDYPAIWKILDRVEGEV